MFLFQPVLHRRPVRPRGYGRTFCNRFSQVYPKITASFDNSIVIFIGCCGWDVSKYGPAMLVYPKIAPGPGVARVIFMVCCGWAVLKYGPAMPVRAG
ncbi:hypothetical protein [Desulfolithobacter dissulfuricans]|uniref:hypothetical protein n=1 Tax=Desulfolithobacter dissulfuricans TaxID=2795293 RepID=UPI0022783F3F|nr:hypothetical protein [Desulfolithobacter dissulfuricans]